MANYLAVAINNLNHYPYSETPPMTMQPHQTLRVGRDSYLDAENSPRRQASYARGGTHATHVVRKGRVSWCLGATIRHGRKIGL
jgi:hypothetical protein